MFDAEDTVFLFLLFGKRKVSWNVDVVLDIYGRVQTIASCGRRMILAAVAKQRSWPLLQPSMIVELPMILQQPS
jgi:hypothetical protein